jgi:hypothetical protein
MAMLIPNEGEIQLLTDLLGAGENWTLKLFQNNITPAETDTALTYTEASFTGYSAKTLTRTLSGTTWSTPAGTGTTLEAQDAKSVYGAAAQSWTGTSAQTIYGYYIVGATSGKLICAERFASPLSVVNPTTINLQPVLEAA